MELGQKLEVGVKVSPQVIQSVSILSMGTQELKEYLNEAILENPVLELYESRENTDTENPENLIRWLERNDYENRVYYQQEKEEKQELRASEEVSLEEYLLEQLLYMDIEKEYVHILTYMIHNLDENGYYTEAYQDTAKILGESQKNIEKAGEILHSMEPLGVGAKDLKECLLLQMKEKSENILAKKIIEEFLEEFGKNQMHLIARETKTSVKEVKAACEYVRSLNPRPSNSFSTRRFKEYLIPDILIVKLKNYFEILINDSQCPTILINHDYLKMMETEEDIKTKEYIRQKIQNAQWIKDCVEQRKRTLNLLGELVLKRQIDFFRNGKEFLKPFTQKEAAQELGISPSTVSRAIKDKYLQCTWGTYPLSFFFTSAGAGEMKESAEYIKGCIRRLIKEENKNKPWSDRIIAEKLRDTGVSVSRRTVAKYRDSMHIGDALSRKIY